MSELLFLKEFGEGAVRVYGSVEAPLFVAADICRVLELSNPTVALASLEEDERPKLNLGRQGDANMVTESGLYALIFRSRKQKAKAFRRWVTAEVLPEIRRTGRFVPTGCPAKDLAALVDVLCKRGVSPDLAARVAGRVVNPAGGKRGPVVRNQAQEEEWVLKMIRDAGRLGMLRHAITRKLQRIASPRRDFILAKLVSEGRVVASQLGKAVRYRAAEMEGGQP